MGAVADLKRRTGVGLVGILLYVVLVAAGIAVATTYGQVDWRESNLPLFGAGLLYAVGLLGVVSATSNLPRLALVAVGRRLGAADGLTAVTGRIETAEGTLTAPLHDDPAVCYTYRILDETVDAEDEADESDADGDDEIDEANWSLSAMGEAGVPFVVDAGGEAGRLRVDPTAAAYHLDDRTEVLVGAGETPPDRAEALRREADIAPPPRETGRRYQEATLAPGDEAFVLGRVRSEGRSRIDDGTPFVVADADYPARLRGRVSFGFGAGLLVSALGFAALLFAAGAL
jgi:hypothetical protein